jgi:flagellin-like protein
LKTPRIIRRRRAVSPVIAAILLIGLAVAAAAVLFLFVLPAITAQAKVEFVSAVAADRNNDGELDKITVVVQNSGTAADTFSDGTISVTGWSAAGNIELPFGPTKELVFSTTDVTAQIEESASVSITLSFDITADISITETDIDMDKAATLTQSDMLMDWQDDKTTPNGTTGTAIDLTDVNAQHSGLTGIKMLANDTILADYYRRTSSSTNDYNSTDGGLTKANSPETWDVTSSPVMSFWIKSSVTLTSQTVNLCWATWDASTSTGIDSYPITSEVSTSWTRVIVDLSAQQESTAGDTLGSFCIQMSSTTDNWYIYLDDVSVHTGLS